MAQGKRLIPFDFVRAMCALGIVAYHYSSYLDPEGFVPLLNFANGTWGAALVAVFFILSGAMLYYNYPTVPSLRRFYWKRWKSIFPMFYLAFGFLTLRNMLRKGCIFYRGYPLTMLLSVLGLDGYFEYLGVNYYLIGEWFLGAIIILYVLYPLIVKAFARFPKTVILAAAGLFLLQTYVEQQVYDKRALASCLFAFVLGMTIMRWKLYEKRWLVILSAGAAAVLAFVNLPGNGEVLSRLFGIALFFTLYGIGALIERWIPKLTEPVQIVSGLSYAIFLVQHLVVLKIMKVIQPMGELGTCLLCLYAMISVVAVAKLLDAGNGFVVKSKVFRKLEAFVLRDKAAK